MEDHKKITGFVLAGGRSSRMGEDKGLMQLAEKPMVMHVVEQLQPCVDELILIANHPEYTQFGYRVIEDMVAEIGPVGGIYTGLKVSTTALNFFVSCDMPFISKAAIQMMLASIQEEAICVASLEGFIQPLFGLYSKGCLPLLEASIAEKHYKLQAVVRQSKHKVVPLDALAVQHHQLFQNINTPEEFQKALQNMLGSRT